MLDAQEHVAKFKHLLTLERAEELTRHQEITLDKTLAERVSLGSAIDRLAPKNERWGLGGKLLITYAREQGLPPQASLRPGTVLSVRCGRTIEGESERAIVTRVRRGQIELAFGSAPALPIHQGECCAEITIDDLTHRRAMTALDHLSRMERGAPRKRRDVLMGQAEPRFVSEPKLEEVSRLNLDQSIAVRRALAAEDYFLVHGPPGTGKSTVLGSIAEAAVDDGRSVLATAYTNAAVDRLVEVLVEAGLNPLRLGHPARVSKSLQTHCLDVAVEEHPDRVVARQLTAEAFELFGYAGRQANQGRSRDRFANAGGARRQGRQLLKEARFLEKRAIEAMLDGADVVCATLTHLDGHTLRGRDFDIVLLDEATQAIEPMSLLAFGRGQRLILAGDHKQLPPTVLCPEANKKGLGMSLFERLTQIGAAGAQHMLTEQYRMHPDICQLASEHHYDGRLTAHPSTERSVPESVYVTTPVVFVDTAGRGFVESQSDSSTSFINEGEATFLLMRVEELVAAGVPSDEIGIIVPYAAQRNRLRDLAALHDWGEHVDIASVDGFQGREKDYILFGFTRSNTQGDLGFVIDKRRLNVAMTRPRRQLFMVGDSGTLANDAFIAGLIEEFQGTDRYHSIWGWPGCDTFD